MTIRKQRIAVASFSIFLCLAAFTNLCAADAPATLIARDAGAPLYALQDLETPPIVRLQKGEALTPMAESVSQELWYMVRTKQGQVGWVRAVDVTVSEQVKDSFRGKEPASSNWAAVAEDGSNYAGSYTVEPGSTPRAARGFWTLRDGSGGIAARGAWSAQMHSTGWNGTWRAAADGRKGDFTGSWSAELPASRNLRFAEMFELAAKESIKGLWTGNNQSGTWSIKTFTSSGLAADKGH